MKHLLRLAPALLLLAACQSNPTTSVAEVATPAATPPAPAPAEPTNSEHIEWDSLTVNDQSHKALSTKRLTSQLGRPDSVAKGAVECGGELATQNSPAGDFWYYGKTMYEVSGSRAVLASFDVTTGKFQGKLGKLILNQNTTLEDVRRFFPVSAKAADTPASGRPGEVMGLPFFDKDVPMDAALNLIFKHGHLQEVEFWYPC